ncbi:MAG: glycosyltransferase family 2 protein [Hyphomonadaceae bacterium]|nr:glycosyltransferase family 2 protein [Hyphomonadaceae bacterium]
MKITVIITMGGLGKRFRDAGYDVPKYRICARGRSLFDWSVSSLQSFIEHSSPFVFVVQRGDNARAFIEQRAAELGIKSCEVVEIDGLTDGQATTAMLAEPFLKSTDPIAIFNIDTRVAPEAMPVSAIRGYGWVPCFSAPGDKWSFARAGIDGRIVELREKKRISDNATLGLYYFSSFDLYAETYRGCFAPGASLEAGEKYIAPMYNWLIADGKAVYLHDVPQEAVTALGTPDDLVHFDPTASPANVV